jgi:3-methyladenine DNA glycosylase/8-oxoguanine DNA glycosylase
VVLTRPLTFQPTKGVFRLFESEGKATAATFTVEELAGKTTTVQRDRRFPPVEADRGTKVLNRFTKLDRSLCPGPFVHQAIQKYRGMRLIRQEPWECLISFLCSSAKAIAHIRCIIELLCKSSGEKVVRGNYVGYGFPEPGCIKTALQLESVGAGFRTGYLLEASQSIDRCQLLALKDLSYKEAGFG